MTSSAAIGNYILGSTYTIDCDESIDTAEKIMRQRQIRHLPVLDGTKIYGIISDRDVKLARSLGLQSSQKRQVLVREMCSCDPYIVGEEEPLDVVATTMARRRLGCAIIIKAGVICGIFTTTDACRLLADYARKEGRKS